MAQLSHFRFECWPWLKVPDSQASRELYRRSADFEVPLRGIALRHLLGLLGEIPELDG
jgi:hypothetical protein